MKKLNNWDNKTWLSSKKYIENFNKFLESKIKLNNSKNILDIGCGRANIISSLQKKYKFKSKPIGIDVIKHKELKRNIIFKKANAVDFLKKDKINYDLIIIKQSIHFFSEKKINILLNLIKRRLNDKGVLLIFSLKFNNQIPCFKKMQIYLNESLKHDKNLFKIIKKNLKKIKLSNLNYKVHVSKKKYMSMIRNRYISCLLNFSNREILKGIDEIKTKFGNHIKFIDTLKCLCFIKN